MKTMLGQFLDISIGVDSPAEVLEQFRALGFQELATLDVQHAPRAVVWDGRVAIGLRASSDADEPVLTFARPELAAHVRAFRRAGVEPAFTHLADDEFHQVGLVDPGGQRVVLNEARTFSPADREPGAVPACGELLEYSVATAAFDASVSFWRRLGLETLAEGAAPHRWARLGGSGLVLGLHETVPFAPGLTFRAGNFEARCDYLRALGRELAPRAPVAVDTNRAATLMLPCRLAIYLVAEPHDAA